MTDRDTAQDRNRSAAAHQVEGFRLSFQQQRIWRAHHSYRPSTTRRPIRSAPNSWWAGTRIS
ncbi:hypothetical protein [Streptomyces malaysiensis]|uniref:hypothetical protein n=1 Tax=Streptomyces malaysiensis TaxID=92644 RepID=UPI0036B734CA